MFEINSHIIQKMGWRQYHSSIGLGLDFPTLFSNDNWVRFFFVDRMKDLMFIVKEMTPEEKQKSKNEYKFIQFSIHNYNYKQSFIDLKSLKMKVELFKSNEELWKLIIENEACNEDYQRHFRLNKILK